MVLWDAAFGEAGCGGFRICITVVAYDNPVVGCALSLACPWVFVPDRLDRVYTIVVGREVGRAYLLYCACKVKDSGIVLESEPRSNVLLGTEIVLCARSRLKSSERHCAELEQLACNPSDETHDGP